MRGFELRTERLCGRADCREDPAGSAPFAPPLGRFKAPLEPEEKAE